MGKKNTPKSANDGFSAPVKNKNTKETPKNRTGIIAVSMILVIALCLGAMIYSKVAESGLFYRNTVSITSEHYEIDNAMLQYFFNTQFQNMSSSLQQFGVNLQKNLKDQKYTSTKTWYDYMMQDITVPHVKQLLVLCEAATAEGFALTEKDHEDIKEAMDGIKSMVKVYANAYGVSEEYQLHAMYGYGINYDDIERAMEISQLAAAYSEKVADSFEYADSDLSAYLEEHKDDFKVVDYVTYKFEAKKETTSTTTTSGTATGTETSADTTAAASDTETSVTTEVTTEVTTGAQTDASASASDGTDTTGTDTTADDTTSSDEKKEPERTEAQKEAYALADALLQKLLADPEKALEIFNTDIKAYLSETVYPALGDDAKEEDIKARDEKIETAMKATVVTAAANDASNEFIKFAFSDNREVMAYLTADDKAGTYTVSLITAEPYIEEYVTRNLVIITMGASSGEDIEAMLESVKKDFEASDKSLDAFKELAVKYSHDSYVEENQGLYENQGKGDLGIEELDTWLYEERKPGDFITANNGKTDKNKINYAAYYAGEGKIKWARDVEDTMRQEDYGEQYDEYAKQYAIDINYKEAYKIPCQAGIN